MPHPEARNSTHENIIASRIVRGYFLQHRIHNHLMVDISSPVQPCKRGWSFYGSFDRCLLFTWRATR